MRRRNSTEHPESLRSREAESMEHGAESMGRKGDWAIPNHFPNRKLSGHVVLGRRSGEWGRLRK